jgi:tetratricopeptide (TPR) repeat protein/mono/diheme cytochrome c family protein
MLLVLLAVVIFAYVALPLIVPNYADPLPNMRDPVEEDLEEERDALIKAIRELDSRSDLPQERRDSLRARYEAKAAKTLRALDEYNARDKGNRKRAPKPVAPKRAPVALIMFLGIMIASASALGGWILPRFGDTTITVANERLDDAADLALLQQAAERDRSSDTLMALAEGYWTRGEDTSAAEIYEQVIDLDNAPALAYRRLGLLSLQQDIDVARTYLEEARLRDPDDLDTLYSLGEVYFATNRPADAASAWQDFLATEAGADDPEVTARLMAAETVIPLAQAVRDNPSEDTLADLADGYWRLEERERAADIYFLLLTEENPESAVALSRLGQVLFFSGRNEDAIGFLARANELAPDDLHTLLFLGNAYFSLELFEAAIDSWNDYVDVAGSEQAAGRVPELIAQAEARLAGETSLPTMTLNPAMPDTPMVNTPVVNTPVVNTPVATSTVTVPTATVPTATVPTATVPTATVSTPDEAADALAAMGQPSHVGERAFVNNCSGCHGMQGQGGAGYQLAGNDRLEDIDYIIRMIRNGRGLMPAYDAVMSDETINNIAAYVQDVIYPMPAN